MLKPLLGEGKSVSKGNVIIDIIFKSVPMFIALVAIFSYLIQDGQQA